MTDEKILILSEKKADKEKEELTPEQQALLEAGLARQRKQDEIRKRENNREASTCRRRPPRKPL